MPIKEFVDCCAATDFYFLRDIQRNFTILWLWTRIRACSMVMARGSRCLTGETNVAWRIMQVPISLSLSFLSRDAHGREKNILRILLSLLLFAGKISAAFFSALKGFACSETWLNNYIAARVIRGTFAVFRRYLSRKVFAFSRFFSLFYHFR